MKLTKRKDFIKALMKYHRKYYTDGGFPSIFSLQQKMIGKGICPRCGERSRCWISSSGHFPCMKCGFKLTKNEAQKICDDNEYISIKTQKRILKRRITPKKLKAISVEKKKPLKRIRMRRMRLKAGKP